MTSDSLAPSAGSLGGCICKSDILGSRLLPSAVPVPPSPPSRTAQLCLSLMLVFPPSSLPFLSLLHKLVFHVHECLAVEASYSPPPPMSSSHLPTHMLATPTLWLSSQGLPLDSRPTHPAALDASHGHHKPLALNMSKVGLKPWKTSSSQNIPHSMHWPPDFLCSDSGNLCQRPFGVFSGPALALKLRLTCKNLCF